jgi:hypothetical protein
MTTGEGVALAVGGALVVGGAVYLMSRKPIVASSGNAGIRSVPKQQAAPVGTAALAIGSGLGGLLTTLFGPSKSAPTTAAISGVSQLPQPAAQSWNNTGTSTFDQLAAGDEAEGVEGPF